MKLAGWAKDSAVERTLVAYAVGSLVGAVALGLEVALGRPAAGNVGAFCVYSVVGGLVAAVTRTVFAVILPAPNARAAALATLGAFALLHLLCFVNVRILPGEPYWSIRSLALDAGLAAGLLVAVAASARSAKLQQARVRLGQALAAAGVGTFAIAAGGLFTLWPKDCSVTPRNGRGPNLLLVVVDSVRRDKAGLHGHPGPTTPALDALAPGARVYDVAFAASSWTVPSVAAMVGSNGAQRDGMVSERLTKAGYTTACFTDNPHLAVGADLTKGFDVVRRSVGRWRRLLRGTALGEVVERLDSGTDRRLADRAIVWATEQSGPLFLYLHLMDSHTPYRHPPIDGRRRGGRRIEFPMPGMTISPEEAEDIVARYEGGIRSTDREVGRLLAAAAEWGRPFVAIITADHGESLGESGRWFHGQTLAPELLAVPLLVLGQGVKPGRVATPVGHTAIPRTLLAAAGITCPECSGPDLRLEEGNGVVEGGLPPDLSYRVAGRFKLIVNHHSGARSLFNLMKDPAERRDVSAAHPSLVEALAAGLGSVGFPGPPPAEQLERLRSLGYAGF